MIEHHSREIRIFRQSVYYTLSFVLFLWLIKFVEWSMDTDFGFLGVYPRTLEGTVGIITMPLIHGNEFHLISNTFPLILLGIGIFYFYNKIAMEVFFWIYFMTGFWVWVAARDAYHIGASGVIYGLVAFLFFSGLFRRDVRSIAVSLIVLFLYRGMIYGLIPTDKGVSWESHILGAAAGMFCGFYFRKVDVDPVLKIHIPDDEPSTFDHKPNQNTEKTGINYSENGQEYSYVYKQRKEIKKESGQKIVLKRNLRDIPTFKNQTRS